MINLKYEAWMDGRALSEISPNLFISSIRYEPPQMTASTSTVAGQNGSRLESVRWDAAKVVIGFLLKKMSGAERQQVVQNAYSWARQGILTVSDRPGQQLHVSCEVPPYVEDSCDWTTPIEIHLRTYEKPFWEEKHATSVSLSGSTGSAVLFVPGNAGKTFPDITITPNTTMANITLYCGNTTITLTGCGATNANPVKIRHNDSGFLTIKTGTTSLLPKRTGDDELTFECGRPNSFSYTSSANVTVEVSARGVWM